MLKKLGFIVLGLLVGIIIGGVGTMAYAGFGLSRGMFMFQDADIIRAEDVATQAYLNESPEIGIWAIENYLNFFESVIKQRTASAKEASDKAQSVFFIATPESRWITYVRLGLLYEKVGNLTKKDEAFQTAAEILGRKTEKEKINDYMINVVKKLDEDFKPLDLEIEQ